MLKKSYFYFWSVLLALVLGFNVYVRLYPSFFPQLKESAKIAVDEDMKVEVANKIKQLYPKQHPYTLNKLAAKLLEEKRNDKKLINKRKEEKYLALKDPYQNSRGRTYLLETDPYQWYRYSNLLLENGYPGDLILDGKVYDDHMLAPQGMELTSNRGFYYLTAAIYKFWTFFDRDFNFEDFVFYLPVFWSLVWLLIIFFLVNKYCKLPAAVLATFMAGGAQIILNRGAAGWYDMDMLCVSIPLLIIYFSAQALNAKKYLRIVFSLLAGLLCGLYSYIWMGWIQVFCVMIAYFVYKFFNEISLNNDGSKTLWSKLSHILIVVVCFYLATALPAILLRGEEPLKMVFQMIISHIGLSEASSLNIWPNTYFTVSELRKGGILSISRSLYGGWFFIFGTFSMFWVYIKEKRSKKADFFIPLIFTFLLMVYASLKGIRFTLFLVTPLSVFAAYALVLIYKKIGQHYYTFDKKIRYLLLLLLAVLTALLGQSVVLNSLFSASYIYPMLNDDIYDVMQYLKNNTEDDAIINSWWDFGNWFKTIADRAVIFDGQSQRGSNAYWMANVLYSDNSKQILNILHMLNNANYKTFNDLNSYIGNEFRTVALLKKILGLDYQAAQKFLMEENIPEDLSKDLLDTIYLKQPRPAYFVVDSEMLGKTPEISYLGLWSYAKLYMRQNINKDKGELAKDIKTIFGIETEDFEEIYLDVVLAQTQEEADEVLSNRYLFYGNVAKGKEDDNIIFFENGLVFDRLRKESKVYVVEQGYRVPNFVCLYDETKMTFYDYAKNEEIKPEELWAKGGFVLYRDNKSQWKSIAVSSKELASSLLVRLYFMGGHGLDMFESFYENEKAGFKVYKINWDYKKEN